VVATGVGGTPDLLQAGAFGRLVPPGDPRALADAVLATLADPAEARRRALLGQAHVLAKYDIARLVADVDGLYRELLAAKGLAA
jgi:glycosyltransferase involved in cell wall biosynthesis